MARFLFVVPPLVGHVNPTIAVGRALMQRGHEVAWVGPLGTIRHLFADDARLFSLDHDIPAVAVAELWVRARTVRGPARLKFLWEDVLLPLARAMLPGVQQAVVQFEPQALLVDQQTLAGAVVAQQTGLPWATSATTSADLVDPFATLMPKVREWRDGLIGALFADAGLAGTVGTTIGGGGATGPLVLVFSTAALVGDVSHLDNRYHFVGPAFGARPVASDFPWHRLGAGKRVLMSFGTVNVDEGARFFREAAVAWADLPVQVVAVAKEDVAQALPSNFHRFDFVPQLAILPQMDVVVCHAGHNTTVESLAHGLPLLVAPIKDDQPIVAQQVVDAGAGLRVHFGRARAPALREALLALLDEPRYREAAQRIQASFAAAGGPTQAALLLEGLL